MTPLHAQRSPSNIPRPRPRPDPTRLRPGLLMVDPVAPPKRADQAWTRLWRTLDVVPAWAWRTAAFYLAGRYLVLLAAGAVVLANPSGAAAQLQPWRGVGEVSLLLDGRGVLLPAVLTAALGAVLVLLLAHLRLSHLSTLPGRVGVAAPVALSVLTALLVTTPGRGLAALNIATGVLLLQARRTGHLRG
ncbi:hypothetical protein GTR02_04325 [Kineococcus sp. R8]|uniref:hypothetical protein n=1 Tax=Kineococcus siccus TaxID=2696567 RepID=UPI001412784A|nr:hypothetical protein [Kineococcus siccus]NAZ81041.1 hypothetical protein [Kineococcus siccus]